LKKGGLNCSEQKAGVFSGALVKPEIALVAVDFPI